jgi:hypothetical protein
MGRDFACGVHRGDHRDGGARAGFGQDLEARFSAASAMQKVIEITLRVAFGIITFDSC